MHGTACKQASRFSHQNERKRGKGGRKTPIVSRANSQARGTATHCHFFAHFTFLLSPSLLFSFLHLIEKSSFLSFSLSFSPHLPLHHGRLRTDAAAGAPGPRRGSRRLVLLLRLPLPRRPRLLFRRLRRRGRRREEAAPESGHRYPLLLHRQGGLLVENVTLGVGSLLKKKNDATFVPFLGGIQADSQCRRPDCFSCPPHLATAVPARPCSPCCSLGSPPPRRMSGRP